MDTQVTGDLLRGIFVELQDPRRPNRRFLLGDIIFLADECS